jgi:putative hydrolase
MLKPLDERDTAFSVDYHMHTTYTDGAASPAAMIEAARANGIDDVMITDHARQDSTYIPDLAKEISGLEHAGIGIHLGVEVKALDVSGALDCTPGIATSVEAIVGSVHRFPDSRGGVLDWSGMDAADVLEVEFELAMGIATRSRAHILGHPMGMAVSRYQLEPMDQLFRLAVACRESGRAFELNPRYCTNPEGWLDVVRSAACSVSFGSDAHDTAGVGVAWRRFAVGE